MDWRLAVMFGAAGGAIVEIISLWGNLATWQQARKVARQRRRRLPSWKLYFDPWPDALVALTRLFLGALAGLVFHGQVTGETAAIAVGAAAPALLRQLGTMRNVRDIVQQESDAGTTISDLGVADGGNRNIREPIKRPTESSGKAER
ncbi:hypothetical protein [Nocardia amamiensis]|uniref:hypothetical protein n=1 Tax=Nocardia amamiensis TaxID=404578 RepID=UPI0033EA57B3